MLDSPLTPPPGYRVRRPTMSDAAAVAGLISAFDRDIDDEAETTPADVASEWRDLDLSREAWLVEAEDGELAAHATLGRRDDALVADGYVHPAHRWRGLGGLLVDLTERAAAQVEGADVLRNGVSMRDPGALSLMAERRYRPVRYFWSMGVVLEQQPPPPQLPDGVTLGTVPQAEWREFHAVTEHAFAGHWGHIAHPYDRWLEGAKAHPAFDPTLWVAARLDGRMIGTANCGPREGFGYVSYLGVVPEFRGRGIGRALLVHTMRTLWDRGIPDVRLHVDAANPTGATALYTAVGMQTLAEYCFYEKSLAGDGRTGR
ncbi:MAG: GNAT family N-acetyltransferase [Gaiellales bacterium]